MDELNEMELAAQDGSEQGPTEGDAAVNFNGVGSFITDCMTSAEEFKKEHEDLFMRLTYNFNGQYSPKDRSKLDNNDVFLKVTRKEVMKAAARINTILNSRQNRAWAIFPTPVPDMGAIGSAIVAQGATPAGPSVPAMPGSGTNQGMPQGGVSPQGMPDPSGMSPAEGMMPQATGPSNGPAPIPPQAAPAPAPPQVDPQMEARKAALVASRRMQDSIEDCLIETRYDEKSNRGLIDMCLYGTMVFFGPVQNTRTKRIWVPDPQTGRMTPQRGPAAPESFDVEYVNIWDFYPEPGAESVDEASWCIVRKMVTKSALRKMKAIEGYMAIDEVLLAEPSGKKKHWEHQIENASESHTTAIGANRYELLDWWGFLSASDIEEMGLELEDTGNEDEEYIWNIQTVNGKVIYMESSEFHRDRLPFYVTPFERIPRKIWGRGPAEMMEDAQRMINACARAHAKNLSYSAGPMLTVDTSRATGTYTRIMPDKIYTYKNTDASNNTNPYQFITVPSISGEMENAIMFYKALIHELTSLPEVLAGVNENSANRTMGQFSMLMGNGDAYLRLVIGNLDTTHTQPMIRNAYDWQMMYNSDQTVKGDMYIEARGVSGVMANELRMSRITELYREVRQDETADIWIKKDELFKELIKGLELDAEPFIRTPAEAQAYQQQKVENAKANAQATNVPKLEAEMSDKDALVETMRKVPPTESAFPMLVRKVAETHNFNDPLLDQALANMAILNTRRAQEELHTTQHKREIDRAGVEQQDTRNAIELEKAKAQGAKARAKFRIVRGGDGAVTGVEQE